MQNTNIPQRFIFDYTFSMSAYFVCGNTLIAKLTEFWQLPLGVSNAIVSLPSMLLLTELVGGKIFTGNPRKRQLLYSFNLIWRLLVPCVFLCVLLPTGVGRVAMPLCFFGMCATYHMVTPAHNAWTVESTEKLVKSDFYSNRDLVFMVLYTVFMFVTGTVYDSAANLGHTGRGFVIIGVLQLIMVSVSIFVLLKKLPPPSVQEGQVSNFAACSKHFFGSRGSRRVLCFNSLWNFSSMFITGFSSIYTARVLSLDYSSIVVWSMVANAVRICAIPVFSKLGNRIGWKKGLLVSFLLMGLAGVICMMITQENAFFMYPISCTMNAIPFAALGIGLFKYQICYSSPENRSVAFSIYATGAGVACIAGASLCSMLVEFLDSGFAQPPYWMVFFIGVMGVIITILLIHKTPYNEQ